MVYIYFLPPLMLQLCNYQCMCLNLLNKALTVSRAGDCLLWLRCQPNVDASHPTGLRKDYTVFVTARGDLTHLLPEAQELILVRLT